MQEDLATQSEQLGTHYPGCQCISEIGSGLNFKHQKFMALMERVARQEVKRLVVAYKDRLVRFGFDFIDWFCRLNGCEIIVLNNTYKPPHQELMEDFMSALALIALQVVRMRGSMKKNFVTIQKICSIFSAKAVQYCCCSSNYALSRKRVDKSAEYYRSGLQAMAADL